MGNNTAPGVLFTFDDGLSNTYDGLTYLKNNSLIATVYAIGSEIGTAGNLTAAQLLEMNAAGMAIGNHTRDHTNLTTLPEADQEAQLSGGKADLDALGLTRASSHIAYPNGASNADTITAMRNTRMTTGRIVDPAAQICPAVVDLYQMPTTSGTIVTATTLADLQAGITAAINAGKCYILLFHGLADIPGGGGEWSNANFNALVDWIVAQGYRTMTINDLYNARR